MKFSDRVDYRTLLWQMYGVLYRANVGVDFVFPESTECRNTRLWWCRHCMWRVMHYWRGWWTT